MIKEKDNKNHMNTEEDEYVKNQVMTSNEVKDISNRYQALVDKVWL